MDFSAFIPSHPDNLTLLSAFLHVFHTGMTLFALVAWLYRPLVPFHFFLSLIIWFSWIVIGFYVGYTGYCMVTDYHWQVEQMRGNEGLPASYIEYLLRIFWPHDMDDGILNAIVGVSFLAITIASGWRYYRSKRDAHTGD
jgi:hypothetical protein